MCIRDRDTTLKKLDFCPLLKEVLYKKITPIIIQNGFRTCGLVPWNPSAPLKITQTLPLQFSVQRDKKELRAALDVLERYIGGAKVDLFKHSTTWSGPEEDKSLFCVWHQMKNDALMNNENVLAGDETVTEDTSEQEVSFL